MSVQFFSRESRLEYRLRRGLTAIAILALVVLGVSAVNRAAFAESHRTDFTVYTAAAQAVIDGDDIYAVKNPRGWMYHYLPVYAVLMVPFVPLGAAGASAAWYVLSAAMVVHSVRISVRTTRRLVPESTLMPFWIGAAAALLVSWPVFSGLGRGQASILLSYCTILAVTAHLERRDVLAGFALAGAIVLKVFPVLILGYFLFKRQWRAFLATVAGLVLLLLVIPSAALGVQRNLAYLDFWVREIALLTHNPDSSVKDERFEQMINPHLERNQSIQAVVIRWVSDDVRDERNLRLKTWGERISRGIALVLAALVAVACLRGGGEARDLRAALQLSAVMVLSLLVSPNTWLHNCLMLALPAALLAAVATSPGNVGAKAASLGLVALGSGMLLSRLSHTLYAGGAFCLGVVAMFAAILVVLNQPERRVP